MALNLVQLQAYLGSKIEKINDETLDDTQRKIEFERAEATSNIAKQMINNADVILRAEKLYNEGGLVNSSIMGIIWSEDENISRTKKWEKL